MNELIFYMAGAILVLTAALAICIVWFTVEINQLRRTEKRIQRLAKAANSYLYADDEGSQNFARGWVVDCLSALMEER
jgi:hypothetical protein